MASPYSRPSFEMLFKEQEHLLKRSNVYKHSSRFGISTPIERSQSLNVSRQQSPQIEITMSKSNAMQSKSQSSPPSPACKKAVDETVQNLTLSMNDEDIPDDDDELTTAAAKIPLDEILGKHGSTYLKDAFRFSCNETTSSVSISDPMNFNE